jgi:hypothetical protein
LPHAIPYDRDETTIMKDKAGISPDEKLLGNKLPVTLNRGASGKIVNTILRAIKQKKQNSANLIPTRSL